MATKNAERLRAHKAKMAAQGLVQCNVWVPAEAVAEIQIAAEIMREAKRNGGSLAVARLVDLRTGKLCGLRRRAAASEGVAA